jgi:hypothetical protein
MKKSAEHSTSRTSRPGLLPNGGWAHIGPTPTLASFFLGMRCAQTSSETLGNSGIFGDDRAYTSSFRCAGITSSPSCN